MQPFDDRTPEEMDTHNAAIVSFLGRVYEKADDRGDVLETTEQEQSIAHVRQRLLQLAQASPSLSPDSTEPSSIETPSRIGARFTSPQPQHNEPRPLRPQQKNWQRRLNVLALVAVMIVLIGSSFFVFGLAQKYKLGTGVVSQNTTETYITPPQNGSRLIGDMLYADQVSKFLLQKQQFTQLNQSQMVHGYQITLDRAYADSNILILGVYAVMPYGLQADKDGARDRYYLPDGDHIQLATTSGVKIPTIGISSGIDMSNSKHEQKGLLLDFDTAGITGNPSQITLNLQMNVHCQGMPPNYQCPDTVKFAFTLPFHTDRQVITPHQTVTANGVTFTLEQVVITPSEARFYVGGWSESMYNTPALDQKHLPASFDETWYNIKLSVQGKTYNLCTLLNPLNCPQGGDVGPSLPLHAKEQIIRDSQGNLISVNTGVSFLGGGDVNPVYLNGDHTILGFALLQPFTAHGQATLTVMKQLEHFVKDTQTNNGGYVGANAPVDDKNSSPWNFEVALP